MKRTVKICVVLMSVLSFNEGNIIRLNNFLNGNTIKLQRDDMENVYVKEDVVLQDKDSKDDGRSALIDEGTDIITDLIHRHENSHLKHFTRHSLCRDKIGKNRFYIALKSSLCHTKGDFIIQLIEDLCSELAQCRYYDKLHLHHRRSLECGKNLYNWVSELFDLNGDGYVDHFEKHFYENREDD